MIDFFDVKGNGLANVHKRLILRGFVAMQLKFHNYQL
jgi:hypothetical protein